MMEMKQVKVKKARKPRGKKLDGSKSLDMCPHCLSFQCDPTMMSHKFSDKMSKRSRMGVCRACGSNPCICKSSLSVQKKNK